MKSFLLRDGDLVVGRGGYQMVTGSPRVLQDLGIQVQEDYGLDRFHPRYGCLLDRYIGLPFTLEILQLARSEIIRMVQNYILIQQDQIKADALAGVRSRYDTSEIVAGVVNVGLVPNMDSLSISLVLRMQSGDIMTIINP